MNLSVAIPALNEEDTIGACLQSLRSQMEPGDEVIVLDNGSTDGTADIAQGFDGVRVIDAPDSRFADQEHYRGLANLRQLGAEKAQNGIVASTDADSVPPAGWVNRIKQHFRADKDLSVLWGVVSDENGVPVRDLTGRYLTLFGGVSGANTAFRKRDFDQLKQGYKGWPMFEDVALITRMSREGKAVHDTEMVMESDLDRRRYQTIPLVAAGGVGVATGALVGGPVGAAAMGTGAALAGTEVLYEPLNELRKSTRKSLDSERQLTPIHHDQIGLGMVTAGAVAGGKAGLAAGSLGAGILGHHVLTEGLSAWPTDIMQNTDSVCKFDSTEDGRVDIDCEPAGDTSAKLTRVLAGVALSSLLARGSILAEDRFGAGG